MKIYLFIPIFMVHFAGIWATKCSYSDLVEDFKGLKLLKIPNGYVIAKNKHTYIPSGGSVVLHCEGNFQIHQFDRYNSNSKESQNIDNYLTLNCEGGKVLFSSKIRSSLLDNTEEESERYDIKITCNSVSANFYGDKLDHCEYEGLRRGIIVDDVPIVSLELCYDFNNSEPIFAHYVAAQRSVVIERQSDYNPSAVRGYGLSFVSKVNLEEQKPPEIQLENNHSLFHTNSKHLLLGINYTYDELASNDIYSALNVEIFKYEFNILNSVPWWTTLRTGNWKLFENIIERQVEIQNYNIYAGKSHRATFPKEFVCNSEYNITFDFDGQKKYIPLYIWKYITPHNMSKTSEEFVLIGINSPFVETDNLSSLVICKDMCDQISWLKPLHATRKMPAFGYIFCCNPKDVYMMLDGFPQMKFANLTN